MSSAVLALAKRLQSLQAAVAARTATETPAAAHPSDARAFHTDIALVSGWADHLISIGSEAVAHVRADELRHVLGSTIAALASLARPLQAAPVEDPSRGGSVDPSLASLIDVGGSGSGSLDPYSLLEPAARSALLQAARHVSLSSADSASLSTIDGGPSQAAASTAAAASLQGDGGSGEGVRAVAVPWLGIVAELAEAGQDARKEAEVAESSIQELQARLAELQEQLDRSIRQNRYLRTQLDRLGVSAEEAEKKQADVAKQRAEQEDTALRENKSLRRQLVQTRTEHAKMFAEVSSLRQLRGSAALVRSRWSAMELDRRSQSWLRMLNSATIANATSSSGSGGGILVNRRNGSGGGGGAGASGFGFDSLGGSKPGSGSGGAASILHGNLGGAAADRARPLRLLGELYAAFNQLLSEFDNPSVEDLAARYAEADRRSGAAASAGGGRVARGAVRLAVPADSPGAGDSDSDEGPVAVVAAGSTGSMARASSADGRGGGGGLSSVELAAKAARTAKSNLAPSKGLAWAKRLGGSGLSGALSLSNITKSSPAYAAATRAVGIDAKLPASPVAALGRRLPPRLQRLPSAPILALCLHEVPIVHVWDMSQELSELLLEARAMEEHIAAGAEAAAMGQEFLDAAMEGTAEARANAPRLTDPAPWGPDARVRLPDVPGFPRQPPPAWLLPLLRHFRMPLDGPPAREVGKLHAMKIVYSALLEKLLLETADVEAAVGSGTQWVSGSAPQADISSTRRRLQSLFGSAAIGRTDGTGVRPARQAAGRRGGGASQAAEATARLAAGRPVVSIPGLEWVLQYTVRVYGGCRAAAASVLVSVFRSLTSAAPFSAHAQLLLDALLGKIDECAWRYMLRLMLMLESSGVAVQYAVGVGGSGADVGAGDGDTVGRLEDPGRVATALYPDPHTPPLRIWLESFRSFIKSRSQRVGARAASAEGSDEDSDGVVAQTKALAAAFDSNNSKRPFPAFDHETVFEFIARQVVRGGGSEARLARFQRMLAQKESRGTARLPTFLDVLHRGSRVAGLAKAALPLFRATAAAVVLTTQTAADIDAAVSSAAAKPLTSPTSGSRSRGSAAATAAATPTTPASRRGTGPYSGWTEASGEEEVPTLVAALSKTGGGGDGTAGQNMSLRGAEALAGLGAESIPIPIERLALIAAYLDVAVASGDSFVPEDAAGDS